MYGAHDKPPPGWHVSGGLLQPDMTVAGHLARMEEVKGVCHTRDCRRRCEVDLKRLCDRGFGALEIGEAKRFLKCLRFDGCALDFHSSRRASLPLGALVGRSHVRVRVRCESCRFHRVTTPEAMIAKLTKDGVHGSDVLVSAVPSHVKGPCGQCGKTVWRADVLWPDPQSEGWRRTHAAPDRNA